jgi:hypothetical protein
LAREPRACAGFGVLLEIKTTRLRGVVSQVRCDPHGRGRPLLPLDLGRAITGEVVHVD